MSSKTLQENFFSWVRQTPRAQPGVDYLSHRHFAATIGAVFLLHILAAFVWSLLPKTQIIDIPVRVLNIKLGDSDTAEEAKAPQPIIGNNNDVENTISRLVRNQDAETQARAQQPVANAMEKALAPSGKTTPMKTPRKENIRGKFDVRQEGVAAAAPVMSVVASQYVRPNNTQADLSSDAKGNGIATGNSNAREAEMVARYEQLISLWIQKFKLYPEEARAQSMQGETIVRIRIDRQGNIRYYILERSTGYQSLDRAATDMIRRANPVPAVPTDYPAGDMFEFLVPVTFNLK